ncbi:MAG: subclass B1 metallo-beta-lactamase [Planctomycetota bacterium]
MQTLYRARFVGGFVALFLGCFVSSGVSVTHAQSNNAAIRLADDVTVTRLADGVWLHTTYYDLLRLKHVPANGLIVINGPDAVMIDTPWTDEQTGVLFDWVAREHKAAIRKVVPTHSHIDCAGGLAEAHRRGADSFALQKTADILAKAGKPAPQNWFTERMSLACGDTRVEAAFLGGGHTIDNIVVWIPAKKMLFGGCLVKALNAKNLGNISESDLPAFPKTLKKVKEAYPDAKIVIPGHGQPAGLDLIDHTIKLCEATK